MSPSVAAVNPMSPWEQGVIWKPQEGPQKMAISCPITELGYGGACGGGKLLSDATPVVTPFGYRLHGDLKAGDLISAADGSPTKVVRISPRQVHPMYRVLFDDGSEVTAGRDHLWNYSIANHPWRKSGRAWKVGTTKQLLEQIEAGRKILLPLTKPVKFTKGYHPDHNPRRVDPYLLGALLGDGCLRGAGVSLTTVDSWIIERVKAALGGDSWVQDRLSYHLRGDARLELIYALEKLGIYGSLAHEKYVPAPYLWGRVEDRFELLRGLMDTDGFIDGRGRAYFTSTSEELASDVRWLVFSLGGRGRITSRIPQYTLNGKKLDGRRAYTVTIRMPDNRDIVSLPRKRDRANAWRENGHGELKRRIASIEYVGEEECHCIAVDHPDSLYLVGDFIVTHNSDFLLGDYAHGIEEFGAAWVGIIFRRSNNELEELIHRSFEIFGPVYGMGCWSASKRTWNFPSGARFKFRYLERDNDVMRYQGHQYAWVGFDELTQWPTDFCYTYLFTRARSPHGAPVYFRSATNPGGPGHGWYRQRFMINPETGLKHSHGEVMNVTQEDGSIHQRVFIPAKVRDNQILMKNDPNYIHRMYQLSNPTLRKALIEGDWDIFAGQAFPEWRESVHVIRNHRLPDDVEVWRAMDWGYKKPYCVLWFYSDYDGNIIVFNEMYGQGDGVNQGSEEAPAVVKEKIENYEATNNLWVRTGYLDAQCWAKSGEANSIYDTLGGAKMGWVKWDKGPGSRVNQKQAVHSVLTVVNGTSRLRIMDRCRNLVRTLPALPTSQSNPEDVDTTAEDHPYDTLRGGLVRKVMTREERRRRQASSRSRRNRRKEALGQYGAH